MFFVGVFHGEGLEGLELVDMESEGRQGVGFAVAGGGCRCSPRDVSALTGWVVEIGAVAAWGEGVAVGDVFPIWIWRGWGWGDVFGFRRWRVQFPPEATDPVSHFVTNDEVSAVNPVPFFIEESLEEGSEAVDEEVGTFLG
jgi:hypothetical protein